MNTNISSDIFFSIKKKCLDCLWGILYGDHTTGLLWECLLACSLSRLLLVCFFIHFD